MFFEKKDKNQIRLDYYETTIQSFPFEKTPTQGGYIKIPFPNARGMVDPNIILSQTNEKFKTENLYIIRNSHSISSNLYDGELILEHKSLTNQDKTVYLVFLLKTDPSVKETDVDVLIRAAEIPKNPLPFVFHINTFLDSSQRILSNEQNAFVLEQPVSIQSSFSSFLRTPDNFLFSGPFTSTFRKPGSKSLLEGAATQGGMSTIDLNAQADFIKERFGNEFSNILSTSFKNAGVTATDAGASGGQGYNIEIGDSAYMECSPTGTSVDTIEMYNIPVNGEFANDLSKISLYRMVITMFFILIVLFIACMTVPVMYKGFVIGFLVKRFIQNEDEQPKYLLVTDYLILILLFTASIFVTRYGMEKQSEADNKDSQSDNITILGFMLFMFTIFSMFIIQIFKTTNSLEYNLSTQKVAFEISVLVEIVRSMWNLLWYNKIFLIAIFLVGLLVIGTYGTLMSTEGAVKLITDYWQFILILSLMVTLLYNAGKTPAYNLYKGEG